MSQITAVILGSGGAGPITTLTGNVGGAVAPLAGNINVVGSGSITVTGNPATHTLTISSSGSGITSITGDSGGAQSGPAITLTGGTSGGTFAGAANTLTMSFTELNLPDTSSSSVGIVHINSIPFLHKFGAASNAFGGGAGNFTMSGHIGTTAFGEGACASLAVADANAGINTAFGFNALNADTTGSGSTAIGYQALLQSTTTGINVAIGVNCGANLLTGSHNVMLGSLSGNGKTGAESSNIIIGDSVNGTTGTSNELRIGAGTGTGTGQINTAFISGIRGITTGVNDAVAVLIDSAGQLGTVSSSERFKDNIEDMDDYSEGIMDLRCVKFNYKNHSSKDISVGLIAEEVEEIFPRLVVRDLEGRPETVKYLDLIPMLLNEVQKLKKEVEDLNERLEELD